MADKNHENVDPRILLLANKIRESFEIQRIILFGSHSRGAPNPDSDVDLFIIMETDEPVRTQAYLIRKEIDSSIPVDIIVRTPQQLEERIKLGDFFIQDIVENGIEL